MVNRDYSIRHLRLAQLFVPVLREFLNLLNLCVRVKAHIINLYLPCKSYYVSLTTLAERHLEIHIENPVRLRM